MGLVLLQPLPSWGHQHPHAAVALTVVPPTLECKETLAGISHDLMAQVRGPRFAFLERNCLDIDGLFPSSCWGRMAPLQPSHGGDEVRYAIQAAFCGLQQLRSIERVSAARDPPWCLSAALRAAGGGRQRGLPDFRVQRVLF